MRHVYSAPTEDGSGRGLEISRIERERGKRVVSLCTVLPAGVDALACVGVELSPAEALRVADALKKAAYGYAG